MRSARVSRRVVRRLAFLTSLVGATLLLGVGPAAAGPVWNLELHHNPTNFVPGTVPFGTEAQYWFDVDNVGPDPNSGPVTLTLALPSGLTRRSIFTGEGSWSCPGSPGDSTITCTSAKCGGCATATSIPRHTNLRSHPIVTVDVAPGACGALPSCQKTASAKVEGGGAAKAATATELTPISAADAPFGILAPSFRPDFLRSDGLTTVREAGAHPELLVVPFDFNSIPTDQWRNSRGPNGSIRNLTTDLPPGFVGNPTAVGECSQAQFILLACPASSQVGRIDVTLTPLIEVYFAPYTTGVFNLAHPRGAASELGLAIVGNPVHIKVGLNPANRYAITSTVPDINESLFVFDQKLTLWGVPADPAHDSERCGAFSTTGGFAEYGGDTTQECPTDFPAKPFLTVPSQCEEDNAFRLHRYDSWQDPGDFGPELTYTMPGKMTSCEKPRFEPDVEIVPTGTQANTPTGLDVHVEVAQNDNPDALATPPLKRFTVTLPEGMSFSPSFADGLQSCTLEQIGLETNDPVRCPDASRIGEVSLRVPILPKAAEGSMYLAKQGANPFGSLFALYLVLEDTEERGLLIKIPGRIDVDPMTGQITTVFDDNPQFPFEDLTLKFRSGPRAPLINPPTCGEHTIGVQAASYARPDEPVDASNTYEVTEGPNGTPCPPDSARRPFAPRFAGGSLNPVAGSYSTFLFRLSRTDDEQELSQVTSILPPGLLAKIAGIPLCPDAAIASISTALGAGAGESASPACPAASAIGTISAGLGAGPGPNYFPGAVYLAGPYKGAPLSLVVIAPGLAGPFDLGNVVVRTALRVDPDTSRVTALTDPFPTILHGVILRVRDVRLRLDRPETTLNPTNCSPSTLNADITGVGGDLLSTADDSLFQAFDYFQVGDCGRLPFKPKLFFKLKGGTHRGDHPAFSARLIGRPGDANIARAITALPRSEFLENAHIGTVCTRVQFRADACPPASVYGHAKAITPLLDDPVEGDLVLRSSDNPLPDLVARLRGQISANLIGRIDSVNGGIRTSFDAVPDVPVTEFTLTMAGGKRGLLVNSTNLCKRKHRADVRFTAQSGKRLHLRPVMQNGCGKKGKAKKRHRRHQRGRR